MDTHVKSYSKIFALGHRVLANLLDTPVVIEEKIDGSQFSFGVRDGQLLCRSNGTDLDVEVPEKMFNLAVATARELQPLLVDGWIYRGEYLQKPKHNTLAYNRVPAKHIILFDIDRGDQDYLSPEEKSAEAARLGLECVPVVHVPVLTQEHLRAALERESCLGGQLIEGLVIKNYAAYGPDGKTLMGKYVSERFKEVHRGDWRERNPTAADIKIKIGQDLRTPARWQKAIQHLAERGELDGSPKDIGALFKEVNVDVLAECRQDIMDLLFKWAWPHISREITRGLPQWYKDQLAEQQFAESRSS